MAEEQAATGNGDVKSCSRVIVKPAPSRIPGIPTLYHQLSPLLNSVPSLNARDMEMAVWLVPDQTKDAPELRELLEILQKFWKEHMLSKLAIPEVISFPNIHFIQSLALARLTKIRRSLNTSTA